MFFLKRIFNKLSFVWFLLFIINFIITICLVLNPTVKNKIIKIIELQDKKIELTIKYNLDKLSYSKIKLNKIKVTNYTARVEETDNSPFTNACNTIVAEGQVAVSQDIIEKYNLKCHDVIYVKNLNKSFYYTDKLNIRKKNQIDIYKDDLKEAKEFAVKNMDITIYHFPKGQ